MQKKKILFAGIALCLIAGAAWGLYLYKKPRKSAGDITAAYTLSATQLYSGYAQYERTSDSLYLDKVVMVEGLVTAVEETDSTATVMLAADNQPGGVNCSLAKNRIENKALPAKGATVRIKGICTGYLMDVNLADAVMVSK